MSSSSPDHPYMSCFTFLPTHSFSFTHPALSAHTSSTQEQTSLHSKPVITRMCVCLPARRIDLVCMATAPRTPEFGNLVSHKRSYTWTQAATWSCSLASSCPPPVPAHHHRRRDRQVLSFELRSWAFAEGSGVILLRSCGGASTPRKTSICVLVLQKPKGTRG